MLPYYSREYLKNLPSQKKIQRIREEARRILETIAEEAENGKNEFVYTILEKDTYHGQTLTQILRDHLIDCNVIYFARKAPAPDNTILDQGLRIYWG